MEPFWLGHSVSGYLPSRLISAPAAQKMKMRNKLARQLMSHLHSLRRWRVFAPLARRKDSDTLLPSQSGPTVRLLPPARHRPRGAAGADLREVIRRAASRGEATVEILK